MFVYLFNKPQASRVECISFTRAKGNAREPFPLEDGGSLNQPCEPTPGGICFQYCKIFLINKIAHCDSCSSLPNFYNKRIYYLPFLRLGYCLRVLKILAFHQIKNLLFQTKVLVRVKTHTYRCTQTIKTKLVSPFINCYYSHFLLFFPPTC